MISETKLGDLFPSAQFLLDGFSKLYGLDRCSNGGGILLYVRDDIPSCLLLNPNKTESIFAEINFRKKNGQSVHPTILIKVISQTICTIWAKEQKII